MPNFDKTGPASKGSKTGGEMGNCPDVTPQNRPFDGLGQGLGHCGQPPKGGEQGRKRAGGLRRLLGKGRNNKV
ncbi:hypothetical protein KJ641_04120 [Patescibacteria group bacterium]|nr:hypothetical protein [Patescibacteria group bacterium]MBU1896026.1 hypothetical protein [Patescibacteria group bacterium]